MNNGKEAPQERKLAIVGFADSRNLAPYDDPSWEIWGVNDVYAHVPRVDVVFEVHHLLNLGNRRNPNHENFLRSGQKPVWLIEDKPEYPSSKRLPVEDVIKRFPRSYITNSISWMIAMAIMDIERSGLPGKIHIFGVDMAHPSEFVKDNERGYCVSPESRILTADLQWKEAWQIKAGDDLVAFDEFVPEGKSYRSWRKTKVLKVSELMRPSYRLTMADGTKLISSVEHRWLKREQRMYRWAATEDLRPLLITPELKEEIAREYAEGGVTLRELSDKHRISWPQTQRIASHNMPKKSDPGHELVKVFDVWDEDRSWGAGYLAAAFDGEGHLSMSRNGRRMNSDGTAVAMGFAQRTNGMSATFEQEMVDRGFRLSAHHKGGTNADVTNYAVLGGRGEIARVLGTLRPRRLLEKFDPGMLGVMHGKGIEIVEKEFIGEVPVIGIQTETGTFICEGYASHNSGQRPSCEYFVGIAEGAGIEVYIPDNSDLCKTTGLYGLHTTSPLRIKIQSREEHLRQAKVQFMQQQAQLQGQIQGIQSQIDQVRGQMAALEYIKGVWTHETDIPVGAEMPLKDRGLPMPGSPLDEGFTFPYQPFEAPQPNPVLEDLTKEKTVG